MNKIVKAGVIVGIIYGVSEVWFALGKGHVLGILAASEDEKSFNTFGTFGWCI